MKLEAVTALQFSKATKSAAGFVARIQPCLWILLSLFIVGLPGAGQAQDQPNPLKVIRQLVKEGVKCPEYAQQVAALVKQYPKQLDDIIAEAVKDNPPCACEIVKTGIAALAPQGGRPDPHEVADLVGAIVQAIQTTQPTLLETIVACATEAAPDAGPLILEELASIFSHNNSNHGQSVLPPGFPSPTHSPAPTPKPPVTPSSPI